MVLADSPSLATPENKEANTRYPKVLAEYRAVEEAQIIRTLNTFQREAWMEFLRLKYSVAGQKTRLSSLSGFVHTSRQKKNMLQIEG